MVRNVFTVLLVGCMSLATHMAVAKESHVVLNPELAAYTEVRIAEFDQIPRQRKTELEELARFVSSCRAAGEPSRLTFICTHNSRRSHMSQLWATVAAAHFGIDAVETYSGGTEATAFNPRAVAALERAGFKITKGDEPPSHDVAPESEPTNPWYKVYFASYAAPQVCFSKAYDSVPNPTSKFCAVMTCSQADKSCPTVRGAELRLAITYEDPKVADDTPEEAARYDERCAQIAREMLYAFSLVR